jgi:hypothetical protein
MNVLHNAEFVGAVNFLSLWVKLFSSFSLSLVLYVSNYVSETLGRHQPIPNDIKILFYTLFYKTPLIKVTYVVGI